MRRKHAAYGFKDFKAVGDARDGTFEALVAVFGNVDLVGDRIVKGAFAKSLERWKESGDPIPCIFNHDWGNLDAHVGQVVEAEERDEGLWVKVALDVEEDEYARKLWSKLRRRTIREMSFAYDVIDEATAEDDVNELRELEIIEVGPTLKGANPETQLLEVKNGATPGNNVTINIPPAASRAEVGEQAVQAVRPDGLNEPEPIVMKMRPELDDEDLQKLAAYFVKTGRVLSAKNEGRLREMRDIADEILSSFEETEEEPTPVESSGLRLVPKVVLIELEQLEQAVNE